jgi:para-nitrobenzyl esterase
MHPMAVVVETPSGKLVGRTIDGSAGGARVRSFLGVPFAKPPVGALRFAPPEPIAPWAGELQAVEYGGSALQAAMTIPLPGMEVGRQDEDCLYLNVFAPEGGAPKKPVLVWIHGGGFVIGSGSQEIYGGARLASRGDVVVVTINYRLGALGFLHVDDVCPMPGAVSNPGMLDQIAALEWVKSHVAAFGGDPANVTIFGESAGGMSVGTLLGMPRARGLFARAIPQSGAAHHVHTREAASRVAEAFLGVLGIDRADAPRALREMPAQKLVDAQMPLQLQLAGSLGLLPFQPVVDGASLPDQPLQAVREGGCRGVSLLAGTTRDEWKLFVLMDPAAQGLDEAKLLERLGREVPEVDAADLVATYRDARRARGEGTAPLDLFAAIQTDRTFRIPSIRLAEAQAAHAPESTFMYRFDWESPMLGGLLGACHAVEIPFVFGTADLPNGEQFSGKGPEVDALTAATMDTWLRFARTGDAGFAAYDAARRATRIYGREIRDEDDPQGAERALWEGRL